MLASNATCTIVVVFAPTTTASSGGTVKVNYNNGLGQTLEVHRSLAGTGIP